MLRFLKSHFKSPESRGQMIRYLVTGFLAFGSEFAVFNGLLLLYSKFIANCVGMAVGFCISFTLHRVWSFKSTEKLSSQLIRYSAVFGMNLLISNGSLYLLSDVGSVPAPLAKLGIMGLIMVWNFVIFKKIIYRK